MSVRGWLFLSAACASLAACASGGGGGGGGTGGSSGGGGGGSPPPTVNSSLSNLVYSQDFTNTAATQTASIDLSGGAVNSDSVSGTTLTVHYDAAAKSYTVNAPGRSQTFTPADLQASTADEGTMYAKTAGGNSDHLTLFANPASAGTSYVGLGFWQRNQISGTTQNTTFDTFTYGLDTPSASAPRAGTAAFDTFMVGFLTNPGDHPKAVSGEGTFSADFKTGLFSADIYPEEDDLITTGSLSGGIELLAGGHLASSGGGFSGTASFQDGNVTVAGPLDGRFYGPSAQNVGASFSLDSASGAAMSGSMIGFQGTTPIAANLSLTDIVTPQLFYTTSAILSIYGNSAGGYTGAENLFLHGQLDMAANGDFTFGPGSTDLETATYSQADQVASSRPNFTSYEKTVNGLPIQVSVYKSGAANSELALTYTTFGIWRQDSGTSTQPKIDEAFFNYGIVTPDGFLSRRTGSATYRGVVYGDAVDVPQSAKYSISGSSEFDVDFGAKTFSGNLSLNGLRQDGVSKTFGTFDFSSPRLANSSTVDLSQGGVGVGQLLTLFYGPNAEEISGDFTVFLSDGSPESGTFISGATAAKRQ